MVARRIRPDESEAFLRLLCDVFGLEHDRAHGIFYNEPMYDLQRKWALFDGSQIISILTTVPLRFGWGNAMGIAGVATHPRHQGQGCARRLLEHVLAAGADAGEGSALLFARETGLYTRAGFVKLDDIVRGEIEDCVEDRSGCLLEFDEIRDIYEQWSQRDTARLRRDEQRWKYWRWTLRFCAPVGRGYACLEGNIVRECIADGPQKEWPIGRGAEWFGSVSMADRLGLRLRHRAFDLHFMGFNIPVMPQMFMTDQF